MDLVMEIDGLVDFNLCKQIVEKYKNDHRYNLNEALNISECKEWSELNKKISENIKLGYIRYVEWLEKLFPTPTQFQRAELIDFRLENHSGGYNLIYPCNNHDNNSGMPLCTFFIHLSDPVGNGETDFIYKKVQAKTGKLIMFPSTWTSVHNADTCDEKYVLMGTFYSR